MNLVVRNIVWAADVPVCPCTYCNGLLEKSLAGQVARLP